MQAASTHRLIRQLAPGLILLGWLASGPVVCAATGTTLRPGTHQVSPLTGEDLRRQTNGLERLRHLPAAAAWEKRAFTGSVDRVPLRYLLGKPAGYDAKKPYPLVLSLHGGAPRRQFEHLLEPGAPGFAYGLGRLISEETQRDHPCFVLAPWSNQRNWDAAHLENIQELLDTLIREFSVDTNRLYVTGQSMGGFGTWAILEKYPDRFAAAVPICGGGSVSAGSASRRVAVWAFHGDKDGVVSVENTRTAIRGLQQAGGQPIYWEYQGGTHAGTAERAYCEPQLIEWLFAQRRPGR